MLEGIEKLMTAGLGALSVTREKAEKLFDECLRRGEVKKEQRSHFVQDVLDAAEKARKDVREFIGEHVEKAVAKMNLATRADVARLEEKIEQLRKKG